MGDFGCLIKKSAMESGGDFWKDRHDEPGEWIIGSSRDFKSGGHYPLSAKKLTRTRRSSSSSFARRSSSDA